MTPSPYPDREGRVFVDLARDLLATQQETVDAIDAKIALLFTTSTALVGILAAVLAIRGDKFDLASGIVVGGSMFSYLLACCFAWKGYRAQDWNSGPKLKQVWNLYTDESNLTDHQLEWLIGNHLRLDYIENAPTMKIKTDALDRLIPALFIQTLTLVLSLVLVAV